MRRRLIKRMISLGLAAITITSTISLSRPIAADTAAAAEKSDTEKTIICIDAGHGGETDGAKYDYDGVTVKEKDINLQIALKLQEELQKYENVEVVMTRTEDVTMELKPRVLFAMEKNADYLVSVHNNAPGNEDRSIRGCMVLTTVSHYQVPGARLSDIYGTSEKLSLAIVDKLQKLGLPLGTELNAQINGLVKRPYSPEGNARSTVYYPDGSVADYYALIRYGVEMGLPAIIIEHAYLSNEEEYRAYLKTEESIAALARADAEGIAEALGLIRKPEEQQPGTPETGQEQIILPKALQTKQEQNYITLR